MKKIFTALFLMCALFVSGVLVQRVFAASYTIRDGGRVYSYTGFPGSPDAVLERAGILLDEWDGYTQEADTITVRRAPTVELCWHGTVFTVSTCNETARELLDRLGLTPESDDVLSVPPQTLLSPGMSLRVDRVVSREERFTRCLPHDRKEMFCPDLPEGTTQVLAAGRDGALLCRAWVTYVNGQESRREVLEESVTTAPITEILAIGTGTRKNQDAPLPIVKENELILPTGERVRYKKVDYVRATAYTHTDTGCTSTTATNTRVHRGTVAVDPRYIPYGTRMFIMASDGSYIYGLAEAEDCGGDIKGDRVDLYLPNYEECMRFGRRRCTVYFLE